MTMLMRFIADESAAAAVEYGLIAACLSLATLTVLLGVGMRIKSTFTELAKGID